MTQPKHSNLSSALAAAQAEMGNAPKNATNPHFRSTYADLASLRDAVIPVLSSHGIALIQLCDGDGQSVSVTTRLLFGEERMDCGRLTLPIVGARNPAQAAGAAITYARRYQLGAVAGVASAEDDDGNSLDGTRAPPAAGSTSSEKARRVLKSDIGCKSREDAEASIRFATDRSLGAADLDRAGDAIYLALMTRWESAGHDWAGYLRAAKQAWDEGGE